MKKKVGSIDPTGKKAHEPGAKLDFGKNRLALVLGGFSEALQEVGEIGTRGAAKYTDNGWKKVDRGIERYSDAMLRHLFKHFAGEKFDKESTQRHLAHVAWNVLALLELTIKGEASSSASSKPEKKKRPYKKRAQAALESVVPSGLSFVSRPGWLTQERCARCCLRFQACRCATTPCAGGYFVEK